jgi:hypothetical protein
MDKRLIIGIAAIGIILSYTIITSAWTPLPVKDDPLVRMPGTQPDQGVNLEAPNRCFNCHGGYDIAVEPGYNWLGSMMAQAARDPVWFACMTVGAQDAIYAVGNPNATDICLRCHTPGGWLGGRSDPTNASALSGSDFDGLHCDFCHTKWDPFFETTYDGTREGSDWTGYWDEATALSANEANKTYLEDATLSTGIMLFSGGNFYSGNLPLYDSTYRENGGGQYFVSTGAQKRASFADAAARHQMLYSRYHKSKYFCSTCHDVSNPVLANLGISDLPDQSGGVDLITEQYSASRYFHVERTFSEFMLSAYGQQGGAATNPEFQAQGAPDITWAAKCQDCHMRDVTGVACNKAGAPLRPNESTEHPNSGLPLHDLTGGNAWVSYILASVDPNGPVFDQFNADLLGQGPAVLTLDLNAGLTLTDNGAALKAGSDRAKQQIRLAGTIKDLQYDPDTGDISFKVQNNTGHKLISGFPEGRRMFVNIKAYVGGELVYEVNPYDYTVGTLKGLPHSLSSQTLGPNEVYVDELVYEVHPRSSITGEDETFHFVLATGRYKDNRIPPRGFDSVGASVRISEPVHEGTSDPGYFSAEEYAGGYDDLSLGIIPGADYVEVKLYYQGTSREYIEFLRDEINGTATTLPASAYIVQTDPFFSQLKAWGDTIWELWYHNHGLDGIGTPVDVIVPFEMTVASFIVEEDCFNSSAVVITGSITDASGISEIIVTVDGSTPSAFDYDSGSGNWTATFKDLSDGPHTLGVTGTDACGSGNTATTGPVGFRVDTTATVTITDPVDGGTVPAGDVQVTGTADSDITSVSLNATQGTWSNSNPPVSGGEWSATLQGLPAGPVTITATGEDNCGNIGLDSITVTAE